ncbi:MAG: secretin N-terminal domain-containing protein [Candidatus Zixiibacteriota bacterium]
MSNKIHRAFWAIGIALVMVAIISPVIADEKADPSEPIKNLQFQAADVRSVMTFLADYGGVNLVVAPQVSGTVTIKLENVKWREAMDIIGRTYDLSVIDEVGGYIRILPAESYRKEQFASNKHAKEQRDLVPLQTKIVKISNSTSDDMVETVQSLMTERGKATSDPQSNSIVIQEVPGNMDNVLMYIAELDQPSQQIKISTQLLEIFSNDLEEIGLQWIINGTYTTESGRSFPQKGEVLTKRNTDVTARYAVTALQHGWTADAIVEAIVTSGKGKIVAHPEITTIDNKEARIQMGQKVPVKQFDPSGNVVIVFEEVGTILKVTPHITAKDRILMNLKPERSTFQFDPNGVIINTSNASTHVIVNNGETAVIGGLTTEDEENSEVGVPFLKDIPLLGRLFKFTNKKSKTRDLVIFVTPTIVDDGLALGG